MKFIYEMMSYMVVTLNSTDDRRHCID